MIAPVGRCTALFDYSFFLILILKNDQDRTADFDMGGSEAQTRPHPFLIQPFPHPGVKCLSGTRDMLKREPDGRDTFRNRPVPWQ